MDKVNTLFLEALKASLETKTVVWENNLDAEELLRLFREAEIHHVLPMIYDAVYDAPDVHAAGPAFGHYYRDRVMNLVVEQTMKTLEFLKLYRSLRTCGIDACVVKGIICRELYPNPDARMSGDEDIFIRESDFPKAHKCFIDYGMVTSNPSEDIEKVYEVSYGKVGSPIHIELHKTLFPKESEAYGSMNHYFEGVHDNLREEIIMGTPILTMQPSDHLFYLICHAFKHFLHSGFGIRQVCDIMLYANAHGKEIDWADILQKCRELRADLFAAAMFKIGKKYLTFDEDRACYPDAWRRLDVDENDMLEDLLSSGVYGQADMSRMHSSNITLNAVISDKRGQRAKASLLRSVFPPLKSMTGRFKYLQKFPFLLPAAWVQRIWIYKKETSRNKEGNRAAESIKIGAQRVELMRKYGIILKESIIF